MSDEYDDLFKIICIGDENSGKRETVKQYTQGFFQEQYKLTIGVEFAVKTIEILDGKIVKLHIWDTGGQERFQYVRPMYYRGAMGAIIFFNISNRKSFEHVPNWIEEVRSNIGEIPIVVVGNMMNSEGERKVNKKDIEKLALEFQFHYMEYSKYELTSIEDIFYVLSYLMIGIDIPDQYLPNNYNIDLELKDRQLVEIEFNNEVTIKKIKKMLGASSRIRLDSMRYSLQLSENVFNEKIWDWAEDFGFKIDGDYLIIENPVLSNFVADLDRLFELWADIESGKDGKLIHSITKAEKTKKLLFDNFQKIKAPDYYQSGDAPHFRFLKNSDKKGCKDCFYGRRTGFNVRHKSTGKCLKYNIRIKYELGPVCDSHTGYGKISAIFAIMCIFLLFLLLIHILL